MTAKEILSRLVGSGHNSGSDIEESADENRATDEKDFNSNSDHHRTTIDEETFEETNSHYHQEKLPSPVADCIRASFLADIQETSFKKEEEDFLLIRLEPSSSPPISKMQASSLIKNWSTPEKTTVSGHPPGPDVISAETARAQVLRQDARIITPHYKTETSMVTNGGDLRSGLSIHRETKMESRNLIHDPDYKYQREQDHYRLTIIDPKVESHAHVPAHSHTMPARKRNKTPDFPSAHSKRSFTKLDPLEQRRTRVKSVEVKQITPHDYLSESLERHRAMSMSPLQDKLRVNERDVNQPWDKPAHPGPRVYSETHEINETTSTSFVRRNDDFNRNYQPLSLPPPQPRYLEDRFQSMGIIEDTNEEDERHYRRIRFGGGAGGGSHNANIGGGGTYGSVGGSMGRMQYHSTGMVGGAGSAHMINGGGTIRSGTGAPSFYTSYTPSNAPRRRYQRGYDFD